MLYNHFKIAWRVFLRRKLYGAINLLGLSIALCFCLLVALYVNDEFSYDKFHESGDRIYLLHSVRFKTDDLNEHPGLFDVGPKKNFAKGISQSIPFTEKIKSDVPEVETLIRSEFNYTIVRLNDKLVEENLRYVDEPFFKVFSFDFIWGNAETALAELGNVVITDEMAMKYFGRLDVLGADFKIGGDEGKVYQVAGVIKKPVKSSISLNMVLRYEHSYTYKENRDSWGYSSAAVFIQNKPGVDPAVVADKITHIYKEKYGDDIEESRERLKLSESNPVQLYRLKSIEDLYLDPTVRFGKSSSPLYSYTLIAVAAIILLIASINYVSISISLANVRSSEVAIRKVVGSSKGQLTFQFYVEALLSGLIAALLGYSLMQLTLPMFNDLAGKTLVMQPSDHFLAVSIGLAITMILSFMAGWYPAHLMSGLSVVKSIKSQTTHRIKPGLIKGMVVFQFTLCIFLLGMGLTMHKQFGYINDKDLGFDKEQVVYLSDAWGISDQLRQKLSDNPSVIAASGAGGIFSQSRSLGRMTVNGEEYTLNRVLVDYDFIETLGFELVQGRSFDVSRNRELEMKRHVVNETMYELMQQDSARAKSMQNVIGVVKDFHFESLSNNIGPLQFSLNEPRFISKFFVRLQPDRTKEGMAAIETAYNELRPGRIAEVSFLDNYIDAQYKQAERWSRIIDLASIITMLIAASGIFGLTAINLMNRMKEMGIRKVLGAGLGSLLWILNRQNLALLLIAMAVASPMWYYFASTWIDSFAYHIPLGWGIYVLATVLCIFIVILTIGFHSFRANRINPTELLRHE